MKKGEPLTKCSSHSPQLSLELPLFNKILCVTIQLHIKISKLLKIFKNKYLSYPLITNIPETVKKKYGKHLCT